MDVLTIPHVTHPGLLIAIGGAEDKTRERVILRYFLEAAGGDDATIVVLATASDTPETGDRYADLFLALRAENVEVTRRRLRSRRTPPRYAPAAARARGAPWGPRGGSCAVAARCRCGDSGHSGSRW